MLEIAWQTGKPSEQFAFRAQLACVKASEPVSQGVCASVSSEGWLAACMTALEDLMMLMAVNERLLMRSMPLHVTPHRLHCLSAFTHIH